MRDDFYQQKNRVVKHRFQKKPQLLAMLMLGLSVFAGYGYWNTVTVARMSVYRQMYLGDFFRSAVGSLNGENATLVGTYDLLIHDEPADQWKERQTYVCRDQDLLQPGGVDNVIVRDVYGHPQFFLKKDVPCVAGTFRWAQVKVSHKHVYEKLKYRVFEVDGFFDLLKPAVVFGGAVLIVGFVGGVIGLHTFISKSTEKKLKGRHIRGTHQLSPQEYVANQPEADGVGLLVRDSRPDERSLLVRFVAWLWRGISEDEKKDKISIRRTDEVLGMLLLGDPGTGKSQIIHSWINQIRARVRSAGVCFDPAAEFVAAHFREGDIVLNPLDARCPAWSPVNELRPDHLIEDLDLIGESFFPVPDTHNEATKYFQDAARKIFKLKLLERPTVEDLISWLGDGKAIDQLVQGTEHEHHVSHAAGPQRTAVLSTLSRIGETLRSMTPPKPGEPVFSLTEWAQKREGWIFLTATHEVRESVRPLHAAMLNILMTRLISVSEEFGRSRPCWFVADEFHALQYLPKMTTFRAEARKYGVPTLLGTQNRMQVRQHYGEAADVLLSAPALKIFLKTNEPESAKWISDCIGNEEREVARVSLSEPTGQNNGKASLNFSNQIENQPVISKEQVMNLKSLCGYWRFEDVVVPFRLDPVAWTVVAPAYLPRSVSPPKPRTRPSLPAIPPPDQVIPPPSLGGPQRDPDPFLMRF